MRVDDARQTEVADLQPRPELRVDAQLFVAPRAARRLIIFVGGGMSLTVVTRDTGLVQPRWCQKKVPEFQVTVNHAFFDVQMIHRGDNLAQVRRALLFAQSSSFFDDVREGLVRTQLHQDVHVVFVLEAPLELNHVRVVDAAVDADLGQDLLPRAVLLQSALRHNLCREGLARARILHRVHHREPALAERSAAHVRARAGLARPRVLVRLRHDAGALHLLGAVLLLLLGFGRGLWGFRNGRDVLLVVRHRG
mmetsp:Transcript_4313/g.18342  ORF Transcript_4313/g.18342 Transcript_4313/m.18342 type:complete len:251 (-) Transcript_4313:133-885(-)